MSGVVLCDRDKNKTKLVEDGAILSAIYLLLWGVVISRHRTSSALSNTMSNHNGEYLSLSKCFHVTSWPLGSFKPSRSHF